MDPVTALGVAFNVLQALEFAGKVISTASKLISHSQYDAEDQDVKIASEDLVKSIQGLTSAKDATGDDEDLRRLCESCLNVAQELLADIDKAKVEPGGRKRDAVKKAIRNVYMEPNRRRLQEQLRELRLELLVHFGVKQAVRFGGLPSVLDSMTEKLRDMDEKLESMHANRTTVVTTKLIEDHGPCEARKEIEVVVLVEPVDPLDTVRDGSSEDEACEVVSREVAVEPPVLVAHDLPSQLAPAVPASKQSFVSIQAPTRLRCGDAACACFCHLSRYSKTPQFLKRLWEVKYWMPYWISNYNIYLLFEKTAYGAPSLGLKFQRKVPWGGEDTIIRFAFLGDTEGIKAVLESGRGSLDDVDPDYGRSGLHYAVQKNHARACQLLLQAGADRFTEDETNTSATEKAWEHIFSNRGPPETLEQFKIQFPTDDFDSWGFSPLHKAVLAIEGFCLTKLLESDISIDKVNAVDARGLTGLHWAALRGDLKAVEFLLDAGADVDPVDQFRCTPLIYAVSCPTLRILELLILRRANVNSVNKRGDTPLHYAARHRDNAESVQILIQAGAEVDRKNFLGNTPFVGAAIMNRVASGRYLLEKGAEKHSCNKYGDTPLRETVYHNCHEFLQMLLDMGTRYDDVNSSGSSILHAVALEGDVETVKILQTANLTGLNAQLRNAKGETAMEVLQNRMSPPVGFLEAFSQLLAPLS